jgi:hypothetical protein
LGGWRAQSVDEQYGAGLRPSTLARDIFRVTYPGLDLSHLRDGSVSGRGSAR